MTKADGDRRLATLRAGVTAAFGHEFLGPDAPPQDPPSVDYGKVIVVGAGLSGLTCAYLLRRLGFDVLVYEAAERVGGRVRTEQWFDRKIEAGAELIGWNFPVWRGLAEAFGLHIRALGWDEDDKVDLTDTEEDPKPPPTPPKGPLSIGGRTPLSDPQAGRARRDIELLEKRLAAKAESIDPFRPWASTGGYPNDADTLDATSLAAWVTGEAADGTTAEGQVAFLTHYAIDNTVEASNQSLLAVLAQIAGGGRGVFADDTETARCREGNQALADKLRATLDGWNKGTVVLDTPVREIAQTDAGVAVTLDDKEATTIEGDFVVLTAPPPVWNRERNGIKLPSGITDDFKVSGGNAVKYFTLLPHEFWKTHTGLDAIAAEAGVTWEARVRAKPDPTKPTETRADPDQVFALFAGGEAANAAAGQSDAAAEADWKKFAGPTPPASGVHEFYAQHLDALFAGYRRHRADAKFVWWTDRADNHIGWGYACPAPGQVARHGRTASNAERLSQPFGRIVFAGEHTCPAFYGYMEGALQSALLAVDQILDANPKWRGTRGALREALAAQARAGSEPVSADHHSPWVRLPGGSWRWSASKPRIRLEVTATGAKLPAVEVDARIRDVRLFKGRLEPWSVAPLNWGELKQRRDSLGLGPYVPLGSYLIGCDGVKATLVAELVKEAGWSVKAERDVTTLASTTLLVNTDGKFSEGPIVPPVPRSPSPS